MTHNHIIDVIKMNFIYLLKCCNSLEQSMGEGLDRYGGHVNTGASSPISDCKKIGSWNVRSLNKPDKLTNVISEMKRMGVGILGVAWWGKDESFTTQLPKVR